MANLLSHLAPLLREIDICAQRDVSRKLIEEFSDIIGTFSSNLL